MLALMSPFQFLTMNELSKSYLAITIGVVIGAGLCVGLQKHLNAQVIKRCNTSINTVAYVKSGVMDIARCVSTVRHYGPPAPLQD
jgi:hypothetical protein